MVHNLPPRLNHDRYIIYRMLGKRISFMAKGKEVRRVIGLIENVCRDIFENIVELTVGGRVFKFKEPEIIAYAPGKQVVLFVYGNPKDEPDLSDKALFKEARASHYKGETLNEIISRTTPGKIKVVRFTFVQPAHHRHG
jgi:hypothetical protein